MLTKRSRDRYRLRVSQQSSQGISGLLLWLDASDASTVIESGGSVSQWSDKSGNSRHMIQSVEADKPLTGVTTQNGLNTISLDGATQYLRHVGPLGIDGSGGGTAFIVCRVQAGSTTTNIAMSMGSTSGAGGTTRYFDHNIDTVNSGFRFNNGNRLFSSSAGIVSRLTTWKWGSGANYGSHEYYLDGVAPAEATSAADTAIPNILDEVIHVGVRLDSSAVVGGFFLGDIAEIRAYNRDLSSLEQTTIESELSTKWGI